MPGPEPLPMACTLDSRAMRPRLAEIGRLTRAHLRAHRVNGRTLRLAYAAAAAPELTRIVELERVCCAFLHFELEASADEVALTITAPEQEGSDAQWLFAQFLPGADLLSASTPAASECSCCRA